MNKAGSSVAFFEGGSYQNKPGALAYRHALAHYLNLVIPESADLLEIGCGNGQLLDLLKCRSKTGIDASASQITEARKNCAGAEYFCGDVCEWSEDAAFDVVLVSDTLNHCGDAQALLEAAGRFARPEARLVITTYNTLWRPALSFLTFLGLRSPQPDLNWLSGNDVRNIAELAGWEIIKSDGRILLPVRLPFLSGFVNRWVAFGLYWVVVLTWLVPDRRIERLLAEREDQPPA